MSENTPLPPTFPAARRLDRKGGQTACDVQRQWAQLLGVRGVVVGGIEVEEDDDIIT